MWSIPNADGFCGGIFSMSTGQTWAHKKLRYAKILQITKQIAGSKRFNLACLALTTMETDGIHRWDELLTGFPEWFPQFRLGLLESTQCLLVSTPGSVGPNLKPQPVCWLKAIFCWLKPPVLTVAGWLKQIMNSMFSESSWEHPLDMCNFPASHV
jgi:hypothetical protein